MKKTMRGFGIGLFIAAACWTAYAQWLAPTSEEQIALLEQQLKDSEQKVKYLQQQVDVAQTTTTQNDSAQQAETKEDNSKTETPADTASNEDDSNNLPPPDSATKIDVPIVKGTILIYDDVTLYDIGKQAEDAGIIENGRELELYLYKPEYSRSIQIGQFELSSDMTLEEMALILTGKTKQ